MELSIETDILKTLLPEAKVTNDEVAFNNYTQPFGMYAKASFNYQGVDVLSIGHALMYGKALLVGDLDMVDKLEENKLEPKDYIRLGNKIKVNGLWEKYRKRVMVSILEDRFSNADSLYLLKATGKRKLVLKVPYDSVWGIGNGDGSNLMGEALTVVRSINENDWPLFTSRATIDSSGINTTTTNTTTVFYGDLEEEDF